MGTSSPGIAGGNSLFYGSACPQAVLSWGNSPSCSDPAGVGQAQELAFQLAFQVTLLNANV